MSDSMNSGFILHSKKHCKTPPLKQPVGHRTDRLPYGWAICDTNSECLEIPCTENLCYLTIALVQMSSDRSVVYDKRQPIINLGKMSARWRASAS